MNNECPATVHLTSLAIMAILVVYIATGEDNMTSDIKRSRYFLDIDPEVRNRVKAVAALNGKTMKEWLTEAIITKLEDEIDSAEGLMSLNNTEGSMSLNDYLKSRKEKVSLSK
jgi:predicted HicB family RNase H-like nuclease